MTREMIVNVRFVTHRDTGLIVAVSDDHRGLYVHGRTMKDVWERVPVALRALLEAEGKEVIAIHEVSEDGLRASGFVPSSARFNAELCEAA